MAGENSSSGDREPLEFSWQSVPGMVWLCVKLMLLQILTLGFYYFWARTQTRVHIWSSIRLNGQALEYFGTGLELFLGFVRVLFLVFVPIIVIFGFILTIVEAVSGEKTSIGEFVVVALFYLSAFYLYNVGQYRARHYRLSRTYWRGIRGGMAGNSLDYGWLSIWTLATVIVTLGWSLPWRSTLLQNRFATETRLGDEPLRFTASATPLYPSFALLWFGVIALITLPFALIHLLPLMAGPGLMRTLDTLFEQYLVASALLFASLYFLGFLLVLYFYCNYRSKQINHYTNHTIMQEARFRLETTPLGLLELYVSNFLIAVLTLTIAAPYMEARHARYLVRHLSLEGVVNFGDIARSRLPRGLTGEGLAEVFDGDGF